ncbi:hypothetical protein QYM36_010326 [Artemia franciscana]|uniref:Profilin n=1 Tax=Artemia franciscana TaxID=6661 RepID=A0AA88I0A2_ARTSF|nr:hypothetical protein QYM36_010326 [Artemia franciscana]
MNFWINHLESELLSNGHISEAAIIGVDGSVWGKSKGFPAKAAELKAFVSKFDSDEFSENGIMMGIIMMYFYLSRDHVRARKGDYGIHAIKRKQLYVIALYDPKNCSQPEAAITVESYGDKLCEIGY